jgi:hypothetical protein
MVRRTSLLALCAAAAPLAAQPVTRPEDSPCTVHILEAPEAVKVAIVEWVRAEPRCERELDVRVTVAPGGLHLVATDHAGIIRERVVPDADSAAVLVVAWMADDSVNPAIDVAPVAPPPPVPAPPPPPTTPAIDRESPFEPSLRLPRAVLRHRWLSLGATTTGERGGVHAQLDLLGGDHWTIGIAGGWREGRRDPRMREAGDTSDATIFASAGRSVGPVELRLQLGIGVAATTSHDLMTPGRTQVVPELEAGAFASIRVIGDWGLIGGPVLDVPLDDGGGPALSAFVGVRHSL